MRKTIFAAFFAVSASFWLTPAFADSELTPFPLVFASEPSGNTIFTMMPPRVGPDSKTISEGSGIAYQLGRDGLLKELYRTKGWYSFKVHVSADGRYLVQMGPWNRGQKPENHHLAVAFHKDGMLLKRYSTAELVKDSSKVRSSVSHYEWRQPDYWGDLTETEIQGMAPNLDYDNRFTLHTIDGWTYVFDVTTGEIKTVTPLARSAPLAKPAPPAKPVPPAKPAQPVRK